MSFADDIRRFTIKVESRVPGVALSLATKMHASIKEGSAVTGSPGQPVDTGNLRESWILSPGKTAHTIHTNVVYAPAIEDGMILARTGQVTGSTGQRLTLRSPTGGFHSVKLTIAGANLLQAEAVRELGP